VLNLNVHPERARFDLAIAGRSQKKLEQVKLELGLGDDIGSFVVDFHDYASVEAAVTQTKVVINAIGPSWNNSDLVVRCVIPLIRYRCLLILLQCLRTSRRSLPRLVRRTSLHQEHHPKVYYASVSQHKNDLIRPRYDYQAYKSNAIIIPSCGFDSVPADVSVYMANKTAKSVFGPSAGLDDSTSAYRFDAGISGGTIISILSWFENPPRSVLYESLKDFSFREREGFPPTYRVSRH